MGGRVGLNFIEIKTLQLSDSENTRYVQLANFDYNLIKTDFQAAENFSVIDKMDCSELDGVIIKCFTEDDGFQAAAYIVAKWILESKKEYYHDEENKYEDDNDDYEEDYDNVHFEFFSEDDGIRIPIVRARYFPQFLIPILASDPSRKKLLSSKSRREKARSLIATILMHQS